MVIAKDTKTKILDSSDVDKVIRPILNSRQENEAHKEYFYSIGLDAKNRIQIIDLITFGSVTNCSPVIREVFRLAIIKNCVSIIAIHNHPSGDTTPSTEDKIFTRQLKKAGEILGVKLLDHVIIGDDFFSFADEGIE